MSSHKNRGRKILPPKMDGENHGKPYEQMGDDLGVALFLETPIWGLFHEIRIPMNQPGFNGK